MPTREWREEACRVARYARRRASGTHTHHRVLRYGVDAEMARSGYFLRIIGNRAMTPVIAALSAASFSQLATSGFILSTAAFIRGA